MEAGSEAEPLAEQGALVGKVAAMDDAEVADAVPEYTLPGHVRVATNLLVVRVNTQTDGALRLHANMDDDQYYYEAVLRFCSKEDMFEPEGSNGDGWQMPQANYKSLEMWALFGPGHTGLCVAKFDVQFQEPVGKRSRAGTSKTVGTAYSIQTGSYVVFKDADGDVHRAIVLTLALYMPNTKQAPMTGACGGQVVIFAYVFDASAMEWYFVVIFCLLNPVPRLKLTRSAPCLAQTVYTQNGVDVKGFPSANVVDQKCLQTVMKFYANKLDEELLHLNSLWWQSTVMPAHVRTVYHDVQNEQMEELFPAVHKIWQDWINNFCPIDSLKNDEQVTTSINAENIDVVLQVNTFFYGTQMPMNHEIDVDWQNVHKLIKDAELDKLDFLTYDLKSLSSPALTPEKAVKAHKEGSGKNLSDAQVLELNDEQFLNTFVHGSGDLANNARMALTRLFKETESPVVTEGKGAIWVRFITLMRDGSVQLPAWVNNVTDLAKSKLKNLAARMAFDDMPLRMRWLPAQVVQLEVKVDALVKDPVLVPVTTNVDPDAAAQPEGKDPSQKGGRRSQRRNKSEVEAPGRIAAPINYSSSGVPEGTRKPTLGKGTVAKIENVSRFVDQLDPKKINGAIDHTNTSLSAISAKLGSMGSDLATLTGSSSGPSNADAATENKKLKHKLELAKGAMKFMLSMQNKDAQSTVVTSAAKSMLSMKDIGFDKTEIDEIFGTSSDE